MSSSRLTELYRSMLRIRRIEEAIALRYAEQEMRCPMHLCIGQEGISAGVCSALEAKDLVFSNHRAHGHFIAKGGSVGALIAELYGLETGCCGGRGGSMHLIDLSVGFMGATPIVGGTVPLAVGASWAASLQRNGKVVVVFFGDGCFEEGVLHESMNFATLHRLPIVFICENNNFSVYTQLNERQASRPIYRIAEAHGLHAVRGDGNDVAEVAEISKDSVRRARDLGEPQFLEFSAYRWREHCGPNFDDELGYRSLQEISNGLEGCPIKKLEDILIKKLDNFENLRVEIENQIFLEISEAFLFAIKSSSPSPDDARKKLYA
jgi:TPP-dependent pyruvate/acetoin dehydrogenase alpha subunit